MRKILVIMLLAFVFSGCGQVVKKKVSSKLKLLKPYTVAVLPLKFNGAETNPGAEVDALFRKMVTERLQQMNYGPLEAAVVESRLGEKTAGNSRTGRGPEDLAKLMGTDAVLYTTITEWKSDIVVRYAYLKVSAQFELYSKDGTLLWRASHDIKESDIRLEKEQLELAIIKAYEPSVQRFINLIFSTLPASTAVPEEKSFFKWLP